MFLKRKFIIFFIFFKNTYIFFQVREWSSVFPACELFLRRLWTLSSGSNPKTSSSSENPMGKSTMSTKGRDQPSPEIIIKLSSQVFFPWNRFHKIFIKIDFTKFSWNWFHEKNCFYWGPCWWCFLARSLCWWYILELPPPLSTKIV